MDRMELGSPAASAWLYHMQPGNSPGNRKHVNFLLHDRLCYFAVQTGFLCSSIGQYCLEKKPGWFSWKVRGPFPHCVPGHAGKVHDTCRNQNNGISDFLYQSIPLQHDRPCNNYSY